MKTILILEDNDERIAGFQNWVQAGLEFPVNLLQARERIQIL